MRDKNKSIISIKPESRPKYPKLISVEIDKIHEIISEQDSQKAMDFLYELLDPYYPTCSFCGNIFYTENLRRMYCDNCKVKGVQNMMWVQNNKEQDRKRKREWARNHKLKMQEATHAKEHS